MKVTPISTSFKSTQPYSQDDKRRDYINNSLVISSGLVGMSLAYNRTMYERISKIINDLKICPQVPIIKETIKKNEAILKDLRFKKPLLTTIVSIVFGFAAVGVCEWVALETAKRKELQMMEDEIFTTSM